MSLLVLTDKGQCQHLGCPQAWPGAFPGWVAPSLVLVLLLSSGCLSPCQGLWWSAAPPVLAQRHSGWSLLRNQTPPHPNAFGWPAPALSQFPFGCKNKHNPPGTEIMWLTEQSLSFRMPSGLLLGSWVFAAWFNWPMTCSFYTPSFSE